MSRYFCFRDESCHVLAEDYCKEKCFKYGHRQDRDDKGLDVSIRKEAELDYVGSAGAYKDPGFFIPPKVETEKPLTPVGKEVIKDMLDRIEKGKEKYGVFLHTNNGRPALQDAYEEALDLAMYLKQRIMEENE